MDVAVEISDQVGTMQGPDAAASAGAKPEPRAARRPEARPEPRPGEVAKFSKEMRAKKDELDKLSPDLWGLFQEFHKQQTNERSSMVRGRYEQGRILLLAEKHHKQGLTAVGRAAGVSDELIRECQLVARRVGEEEVHAFLQAANASAGSSMGWVHLTTLAAIESPEVRMKYIQRSARQNLSVDQLRRALEEDGVKVYSHGFRAGGGRPFALPSNPVAVLDRMRKQTEQLQRFMVQATGADFVSLVRETPAAEIGPAGLARMEGSREVLGQLHAELGERLGLIDSLLAEVRPGIESAALPAPAAAVPMPPPAAPPASPPTSPAFRAGP